MSCLVILESAFIHFRDDRATDREQLDETFQNALAVVIGFLTSLEPQTVRNFHCGVIIWIFFLHFDTFVNT